MRPAQRSLSAVALACLVITTAARGEPSVLDTQLAILTSPQRSFDERKAALAVLKTLDPREVVPRVLHLLAEPGRERPTGFARRSYEADPLDPSHPFDVQLERCAGELREVLESAKPSPEFGRFLATRLQGPQREREFAVLQNGVYRHWVPELEAPMVELLKTGARVDLRATAADLLVSHASATRHLPAVLAFVAARPKEEQARIYLDVFTRRLTDLTVAGWTDVLRAGFEILARAPGPEAAGIEGLSVTLGRWVQLPLGSLQPLASPEEIRAYRAQNFKLVREWYAKHRGELPRVARETFAAATQ